MGAYVRCSIFLLVLFLIPHVFAENSTNLSINNSTTVLTVPPEHTDVSSSLLQEVSIERELLQQRNEMYNTTLNTLMFFAACFAILITILGIIAAIFIGMGMIRNNREIQDLKRDLKEEINTHFERKVQKAIDQIVNTMKEDYAASVKDHMVDVDERIEQLQKTVETLSAHHDQQQSEPAVKRTPVAPVGQKVEKQQKNIFDAVAITPAAQAAVEKPGQKQEKKRGEQ